MAMDLPAFTTEPHNRHPAFDLDSGRPPLTVIQDLFRVSAYSFSHLFFYFPRPFGLLIIGIRGAKSPRTLPFKL